MTRLLTAVALAAALGLGATRAAADDPKLPDTKAFDKLVIDALRGVHNTGADIYNEGKDFGGAYRLYQGALMTVRPLLAHRPEAQKLIDDGLSIADKETDAARKAFALHEAIEGVRKNLKAGLVEPKKPDEPKKVEPIKKPEEPKKVEPPKVDPPKKPEEPKKVEPPKKAEEPPKKPAEPPKKPEEPKKVEPPKKPDPAPAPKPKADATVSGKVTLAGKPLPEGEVAFVSAGQPQQTHTAAVKDGAYKFAAALPAGKYAVQVTGKGVPAKYNQATTSGLTVEVAAGANTHIVDLE